MPTQLTRNQIISLLRAEKSYLTKEFGVVNIGLFGSFATGRSDMDSDIDLIVELTEPRFDYLAGLLVYLECTGLGYDLSGVEGPDLPLFECPPCTFLFTVRTSH